MRLPKLLLTPVRIRIFGSKTTKFGIFWPNISIFGQKLAFWSNIGVFGQILAFLAKYWHFWPIQCHARPKNNAGRCLDGFSVMWVPSLLRPPQTISKFGPKTAIFAPKYASLGTYRPCRLTWCPVGWWLWRADCMLQDTYSLYNIQIMILIIVFKGWSTWFREMDCHSSLLTGVVHLLDLIYLKPYIPRRGGTQCPPLSRICV